MVFNKLSQLTEPFIEFFRYLPAPAFGALAVAILGINDAPKIAIIVIGTLFQQILIIANTTRLVDRSLIEAGFTLGTNKIKSLFHVVIPAAMPEIYRNLRVLLGWAWTYLIVAELIGSTSGITVYYPTGSLSELCECLRSYLDHWCDWHGLRCNFNETGTAPI